MAEHTAEPTTSISEVGGGKPTAQHPSKQDPEGDELDSIGLEDPSGLAEAQQEGAPGKEYPSSTIRRGIQGITQGRIAQQRVNRQLGVELTVIPERIMYDGMWDGADCRQSCFCEVVAKADEARHAGLGVVHCRD